MSASGRIRGGESEGEESQKEEAGLQEEWEALTYLDAASSSYFRRSSAALCVAFNAEKN